MPLYFCPCDDEIINANGVTIRVINGVCFHDISCEKCGEFLQLSDPKTGCAGFSSNKMGQVR